jgi:hypothetical protein
MKELPDLGQVALVLSEINDIEQDDFEQDDIECLNELLVIEAVKINILMENAKDKHVLSTSLQNIAAELDTDQESGLEKWVEQTCEEAIWLKE